MSIYKCGQRGIGPCRGTGWHRQTYHTATGIAWSEECCPWYPTKAEAMAAEREARAERKAFAAQARGEG